MNQVINSRRNTNRFKNINPAVFNISNIQSRELTHTNRAFLSQIEYINSINQYLISTIRQIIDIDTQVSQQNFNQSQQQSNIIENLFQQEIINEIPSLATQPQQQPNTNSFIQDILNQGRIGRQLNNRNIGVSAFNRNEPIGVIPFSIMGRNNQQSTSIPIFNNSMENQESINPNSVSAQF